MHSSHPYVLFSFQTYVLCLFEKQILFSEKDVFFFVSCFSLFFLHPKKRKYVLFLFLSLFTGHLKTMKSLSFTAIIFISLSIWLCIDGKSGSKKGSKGTPICFEDPTECTDRTSGKGSKGSAPFTIWCKEDTMEVCRNKDPKSHSADRYEEKRCSFCSLVYTCHVFFPRISFKKNRYIRV